MSNRQITLVIPVAFAEPVNRILNRVFGDVGDNLNQTLQASATGTLPASHFFTVTSPPETEYEVLHDLKDKNICPERLRGDLPEAEANAAVAQLLIFPMQHFADVLPDLGLTQIVEDTGGEG